VGEVLVRAGLGAIAAAIAALAMGFAVKSGWVPFGPADAESQGAVGGASPTAAIQPDIFALRFAAGPEFAAGPRVQLASLETDIDSSVAAEKEDMRPKVWAWTTRHASFDDRFTASFGARAAEDDDSSVTFGRPVLPMPLVGELHPPRETFAPPAGPDANGVPAPEPAKDESAHPVFRPPLPKGTPFTPAALPAASRASVQTREAPDDSTPPSTPDREHRIAVYDIAAHAVYLPNGVKLEAHSGLGSHLDDPRYVSLKRQGPTPPNIYDLALRKEPFHGVRAIRLIPVDQSKMFGRDGMLAHTYMLGSNGQSNGCVSFNNYPAFLNAFMKGEVDRLIVVDHLTTVPEPRTGLGWLPESIRNWFKSS
jgi:hypothetical protein